MILLAFGTRPEYLKIKPIIDVFVKNNFDKYRLLFTGQHTDLVKDIVVDYVINIVNGDNRLDSIISSTMNTLTNDIWNDISMVLIQGDTTSVLGIALSAFHHNKTVIHLEAGLRTYNKQNPFPEETNRRMVSSIADIHLCPTELSKYNLEVEKTEGDIYVVGNTILDSLIEYKDKCVYGNKILITLHRRENHHWLDEWFYNINELAKKYTEYEFILPIHPNPNVIKYKNILTHVNIVEPLNHDELINVLINSRLVITDSGGIQEEASFFNKKCLVCRKYTERPEALKQTSFIINEPNDLIEAFNTHINNYVVNYISPFGDGYSSYKIYDIIKKIMNKNTNIK